MRAAVLALTLVCAAPLAAAAQEQSPVTTASENAFAALQSGGPMTVQRLHTTFVIAPEAKYTQYDDKYLWMAGAYGGVLLDEQWLVGFGGYGLANGGHDRGLWYFGGVFGWMPGGDRPITVSARALIGFGEATVTDTYVDYVPIGIANPLPNPGRGQPPTPALRPITYSARYHENVFVAEPQVDAIFRMAKWVRFDAGVGYRAVDTYHYYGYYDPYYGYYGNDGFHGDHRLHGASVTLSLQIGSF